MGDILAEFFHCLPSKTPKIQAKQMLKADASKEATKDWEVACAVELVILKRARIVHYTFDNAIESCSNSSSVHTFKSEV